MKKTDLRITFSLLKDDWLCLFPPPASLSLLHRKLEHKSPDPQTGEGATQTFPCLHVVYSQEKRQYICGLFLSVGNHRDMQLCGIQSPWKAKAENPLSSSLPEGLQVNLKASLSPSGQTHVLLSKVLVSHFIPWLT